MAVRMRRPPAGAADTTIAALEARIGHPLPADYRGFLVAHDGGPPDDNEFSVPATGQQSGVRDMLSVAEIHETLDDYQERMPSNTVPIADDESGNAVCIVLTDGSIVFFDHELEGTPQAFSRIAVDFDFFWDALRPWDPDSVTLDPNDVISVWISPDAPAE